MPICAFCWTRSRQLWPRGVSAFFCVVASLLVTSFSALGAFEKARVKVTLNEVPVEKNIRVELFIAWGPRNQACLPGELKRQEQRIDGPRKTGTVSYSTETMDVDRSVSSFIYYGRVVDDRGNPIRFIPAKLREIGDGSLNQIEISVTPRKTFADAFLDSYPLEFGRDDGYLKTENMRTVLCSFKRMTEYAGEIGITIDPKVWGRFHDFFGVNRGFFRTGGSKELSDVLAFLKTYSSASHDPGFALFYAEFLNGLVGLVQGTTVFDGQDFTNYVHGQLKLLYGSRLSESFGQAASSLSKFSGIRNYKSCLELAHEILGKLTQEIVSDRLARSNVSNLLLQTTICGQYYYATESGDTSGYLSPDNAAKFLSKDGSLGLPMMEQYLRVTQMLFDKQILSVNSIGRWGEIVKFHVAYRQAIGGAPGQ